MTYTFIERIGQGGFGIVDKVKDEHGRIFARKTFHLNQGPAFPKEFEGNAKSRFAREARYQAAIKHKNIVPIIDQALEANPPYFIMPLAAGSLEKDIAKGFDMQIKDVLTDILAGLEEIHGMEIWHRDLKPGNVMRFKSEKGDEREYYYAIGDFGLMSTDETKLTSLTSTDMAKGRDAYTAPEIIQSLKKASAQSDIFSVGCIIHDIVGTSARIPAFEIKENGLFGHIMTVCTRMEVKRRFKSVVDLREAILSLGDITMKPKTERGEAIFELLKKDDDNITEKDWDNIISFIDDEYNNPDSIATLRSINFKQIDNLLEKFPAAGSALGKLYAKWIREAGFDFNECDGLANRLERFITHCGIDVQAECLMALLYMGTSHNRWYVERKFVDKVDGKLEEGLAKRLSLEFLVDGDKVCEAIRHLTKSIRFSKEDLHPMLLKKIVQICG
jgi:serine/threonine protein kinase